ncbi:MazG nucleotide pyrophosphohydrolase domain-containing protein [Agathobaculum sp. NTUH-O15-33]|uniref:MazG nucleotide pyrophosphohydrolase domain-containing protein n=1 Tax=Agathobaculum sp. NTUH-O15-33 TaxID=3079302 RepID=UPI002958516E|nr:MazG nucleotide pyrophosphohydrolase domain-containing protein [Agathobaculum sp. NTUH-O15-33]WNX83160.1 MazG nucleotide pyrophosphohydrolase domain-containing protein [Agathobaculum sp. NTUH-O15-33]
MVDFKQKEQYTFDDLLRIIEILRAPDGCMWDREQDHHSIRRNFIEETYEVCEAIDEEDAEHLKEELGDVLLQVVFHTEMEREKGVFDIGDVADGVCKKLIYRHPHIFADTVVASSAEILNNWDDLKRKEKKAGDRDRRAFQRGAQPACADPR